MKLQFRAQGDGLHLDNYQLCQCRLEVMTHNVDGIECEVIRLLFEEGIALDCADTIHDGDYVFMSLNIVAPHYTEEMWKMARDKLLRMVRLSNVKGLGQQLETGKVRVDSALQILVCSKDRIIKNCRAHEFKHADV